MQFRKSLPQLRPTRLFPQSRCSNRAVVTLHTLMQVIPVQKEKKANVQLRHDTAEHGAAGEHSGLLVLTAGSIALAAIPVPLDSGFTSLSSIYDTQ